MIFLAWMDYDGTRVEKYQDDDQHTAEKKAAKILSDDGNGQELICVVQGYELKYEVIEVAAKVKFVR